MGKSSGANDRGVADASEEVAWDAAGGSRRGDSALLVDSDRADGAMSGENRRARGGLREFVGLMLFACAPSFARARCDHFGRLDELHPARAGEAFRAKSSHQDVRRLFHHGASESHWIAHAAENCDRPPRYIEVDFIRRTR